MPDATAPAGPDPAPLDPAALKACFPCTRERLADDVFEIGLVLGGTVSAGAYTAGVLDMLMEALDAWELAKQDPEADIPRHKVVISTIGGASGGAINGAIFARAASWAFPRGADPGNPFYATWTEGVDLRGMLSADGEDPNQGPQSILNCSAIERRMHASIAFQGAALGTPGTPRQRSYLADPLRVTMMVSNMTGVPYRIVLSGETKFGHDMVAHADWMRFALCIPGGVGNKPGARPDELALEAQSAPNWNILGAATLATSAFPLAFKSRALTRGKDVFGYRAVLVPGDGIQPDRVMQLLPVWATLQQSQPNGGPFTFTNVDGGVTNNDPIDVVRTDLAGLASRNPRPADQAYRAVILIAPFSDAATLGPISPPGLAGLAKPFIDALISQARFKPEDLALAEDTAVNSRFLIAPVGPGAPGQNRVGAAAIASGGMSGFLGFVDPDFMKYDFMLGRWNAYRFLKYHFAFPANNVVFRQQGTALQPMIPLCGVTEPVLPQWPTKPVPDWLARSIETRLNLLLSQVKAAIPTSSWLARTTLFTLIDGAWLFLRGSIRDAIVAQVTAALDKQQLLTSQAQPWWRRV